MPEHKAKVGSISHGMLMIADLMGAFADELLWLDPIQGQSATTLASEAKTRAEALEAGAEEIENDQETLMELFDRLQEHAPPYCYFGQNEGNGSDFGFWPCMEQIEELPRVSDPADVPEGGTGEDVVFVNDHGNVTVYGADGSVLLDIA